MKSISEEINEALAEESLKDSVNGVVTEKSVFEYNTVTMPLGDFIVYHEAITDLSDLVDEILNACELNYDRDALRVHAYDSGEIMRIVKRLKPLHYRAKFEQLFNEGE